VNKGDFLKLVEQKGGILQEGGVTTHKSRILVGGIRQAEVLADLREEGEPVLAGVLHHLSLGSRRPLVLPREVSVSML
jgi:hypothetical protein